MEEVILPGSSLADGAVSNEQGAISSLYDLVCDDKGLVIGHTARGQPTKFCSQIGDMVKFTAAENNSSSEVKNCLESIKIFLRPITVSVFGLSTAPAF